MYVRDGSRVKVEWNPENEQLAIEALAEILEDVSESELPDAAPVEVDRETADAIRERYAELVDSE